MTEAIEWEGRVGHSWASEWRRTDRSFGELTGRLLDAAQAQPFAAALDIGCGAGDLSVRLAQGNPATCIQGIDISSELLAVARERAANLPNCTFALSDAARWRGGDDKPDLLVSRHGVMFFADPVAAFIHLSEISAPGARLVFSCFRTPHDNPWATGIARMLPGTEPPGSSAGYASGPFAFADPDLARDFLGRAGWRDVQFHAIDYAMIAGGGADPVADAVSYFQVIGPGARAVRSLEGSDRAAFLQRLEQWVADHLADGIVAFPAAAWIVVASA